MLILAFSLVKSSLFVIIEYALLNKEETILSLQLDWWRELYWRCWSVCVGFLYPNIDILPLFCFNKVSRNASSPLLSSFIVNLIFWQRLLMWWKRFSKFVRLKMEYRPSTDCSQTFEGCSAVDIQYVMSLHTNLCCGWRCWSYHCNVINLLLKLRIKSVPGGC